MKEVVILDTDFILYSIRNSKSTCILIKILNDLKYEPIVHEFVYKQEMISNDFNCIKNEKLLKIYNYSDFLKTNEQEEQYKYYFETLYKYANGRTVKYNGSDFKTYREANANMGEIHSLCMAMLFKCPILLSNDNASKNYVKYNISSEFNIKVMNIVDVIEKIVKMVEKTIDKKDIDLLFKGDKTRKDDYKRIKQLIK